jgi:dTDP-4-amino-4,6-dideoxygalactose transaminase
MNNLQFGGRALTADRSPLFPEKLHVGRPNVGDRHVMLARIAEILDRRWLTNDGPLLKQFEAAIGDYVGAKHCIAVCNATIGLQMMVRAAGLTGEVIVPSFTFPATVHALAWEGVTPVFCDVDPRTHNIDPHCADRLVTPRTTGILGVHLWGNPCDTAGLAEVARRHGLQLLYDAAHAFGCSHQGQMIGNFGRAEVFSFHATKFLNSGEGGAIVTSDDLLARKLRLLRSFGIEDEQIIDIGGNAKMSELAAAMGLTSFESRERFIQRNQQNLAAYQRAIDGLPGLSVFAPPSNELHNRQYIVLDVESCRAGVTRDEICEALHRENVIAKRYFFPGCHRMKPYRMHHDPKRSPLPHTEALCERLIQLPTGTAVGSSEITAIGHFLSRFVGRARRAA